VNNHFPHDDLVPAGRVHTGGVTRVIAGEAGGRRLAVPVGRTTRPTSDRAREGLFATVRSIAGPLAGKRVLDLYAGSGAVGIEALSRGAAHVLLVESAPSALRTIRANIDAIGLSGAAVAAGRVERVLAAGPGQQPAAGPGEQPYDPQPYDMAFADPPYATTEQDVTGMLEALRDNGWLAPGALVVVERSSRAAPLRWPAGYRSDKARRYGEVMFWYGLATRAYLPKPE
jgi:16S rRNA (guanine966-N2)-methyltransferase